MSKRLNSKGYMLVEIILASVLAMGIAYFITDLTIKLKNKNDDLLVKTLVSTDQTIIYNTIMKEVYNGTFKCDNIAISGKTFTYAYDDGTKFTNVVSDYVTEFSDIGCTDQGITGTLYDVEIRMTVKQLPDENFNIDICYGTDCDL